MSSVMQEFTKGLWKDLPPFRLVLGLCPTLRSPTPPTTAWAWVRRSSSCSCSPTCSSRWCATSFPKSPHRLLHRPFPRRSWLPWNCSCRPTLPAVPAARHFRAAHRGELHHPGPGRSLRRQKHGPVRHRGRAGHGAGLHHVPDFPRFHPRSVRGWNAVRDAGDVEGFRPFSVMVEAPGAFLCSG